LLDDSSVDDTAPKSITVSIFSSRFTTNHVAVVVRNPSASAVQALAAVDSGKFECRKERRPTDNVKANSNPGKRERLTSVFRNGMSRSAAVR
jgi:hypothetical protein